MGDRHLVIHFPYLNIKRLMKLGILEPFIFYKLRVLAIGFMILHTSVPTVEYWKLQVLFLKTKFRYSG